MEKGKISYQPTGELFRELVSDSPEETDAFAAGLAVQIQAGSVLCLYGNLGSGKTHFSKALGRALGVTDEVTSPSFTVINEYRTDRALMVYHFDFYRLTHPAELVNLGLEDYIHEESICLIEWPEKVRDYLPLITWEVVLEPIPGEQQGRKITVYRQPSLGTR